ncbi:MAG: outer membrane protein assembly factor BamD [Spirochaetes bacterium]|nr:outer membrane protein assembly factor BamD [Spirochaetota bacterium]
MKRTIKISICALLCAIIFSSPTWGNEELIIKLAETYYQHGDYFNAITESLRYQFLYPKGKYHAKSMILEGKAYWKGKNPTQALEAMNKCFEMHPQTEEGEEALLYSARMRLLVGSPYFAHRTLLSYEYLYNKGKFLEEIHADKCYSLALMGELTEAKNSIAAYMGTYKNGKYYSSLKDLEKLIDNEERKPHKSYVIAIGGSIIIPGFGHFYAGDWKVGMLSFASTVTCFYLAWDGYRDDNIMRSLLFGVIGVSLYQHSLFSSSTNVYHYNSRESFYKKVMLGYTGKF